ncbi:hypothetical protein GCM10027443_16810 [Pontibacter brevis]
MAPWRKIFAALTFLLMFSVSTEVLGQEKQEQPKTRILFLLDASGSMLAKWENSDRMTVAKNLLAQLVDSLERYDNLELALRVYGHQFGRERNDCKDTRLEVPFSANSTDAIQKTLKEIIPRGNTPITYSLQQSAGDFPDDKARNVLILITDGLESCGGDPCAMSLALQKKRIFLRPFVIGIGIEPQYEKQLSCIGQYFNAADVQTFENVLTEIVTQALSQTTVSVELLNEQGQAVESNVNMTFLNSLTGQPEYNFVHYQSSGGGKADMLNIDALLPYDLVVNTIPAVVERNINIRPGKHNVIKVKSPQGTLHLRQDGPSPYGQLPAIVKPHGSEQTLHVQQFGEKHKYLTGTYDLEILTLPRIYMKGVELRQGQTNTVTIPPPGQLAIPSQVQGYGSIYLLEENGNQRWLYNLPEENSKVTLALQPGNYRLVYRMKTAQASKFTDVKDFTIRSGATTTVKIFNR